MTYTVIVEHADGRILPLVSTLSERRALELAHAVMIDHGQASGVKVHVKTADSADQLQVTMRGRVLRDQPHLDATGEALTIHVPTAEMRLGQ